MDKKYIFIGGMVVFLIAGCILFFTGKKPVDKDYVKRDDAIKVEHIMYFDAGALIRLNFIESYEDCEEEKCLRSFTVQDYVLVDSTAKKAYKEVNLLENHNLNTVLNSILVIAEEKELDFEKVKIYTDVEDIETTLHFKEGIDADVSIDTKEKLILTHQGEDVLDKEMTTTTVSDRKTSKKFSAKKKDVSFKNKKKGYSYSLDDDVKLSVTAKGKGTDLAKIKSVKLYLDVSSLEEGKKKIKVYVDNDDDDVTYTVSPSSISVTVVKDSNEEDNNETDNNTPTSPDDNADNNSGNEDNTPKEGINLNDNVEYYELGACYKYVYVEPDCLNLTIGELKTKYPDYNKELDNDSSYKDEDKFDKDNIYTISNYFPGCIGEISSNIKAKLEGVKGFLPTFNAKSIEPSWIKFKDSSYDKYLESVDFAKYSLYPDQGCGDTSGGNPTYSILDESMCKKYNLTCNRW